MRRRSAGPVRGRYRTAGRPSRGDATPRGMGRSPRRPRTGPRPSRPAARTTPTPRLRFGGDDRRCAVRPELGCRARRGRLQPVVAMTNRRTPASRAALTLATTAAAVVASTTRSAPTNAVGSWPGRRPAARAPACARRARRRPRRRPAEVAVAKDDRRASSWSSLGGPAGRGAGQQKSRGHHRGAAAPGASVPWRPRSVVVARRSALQGPCLPAGPPELLLHLAGEDWAVHDENHTHRTDSMQPFLSALALHARVEYTSLVPTSVPSATRPAGLCVGSGHVVVYGNPAFVAQFGDRCLGMPAREVLVDLPTAAFELLDAVFERGQPFARWISRGGRDVADDRDAPARARQRRGLWRCLPPAGPSGRAGQRRRTRRPVGAHAGTPRQPAPTAERAGGSARPATPSPTGHAADPRESRRRAAWSSSPRWRRRRSRPSGRRRRSGGVAVGALAERAVQPVPRSWRRSVRTVPSTSGPWLPWPPGASMPPRAPARGRGSSPPRRRP